MVTTAKDKCTGHSTWAAHQPSWSSWALTHTEVPDMSAVVGNVVDGKRGSLLQTYVLETPGP